MNKVTLNKANLIETVQKNREQHAQIFEEAKVGYKEKALAKLRVLITRVENNERFDLYREFKLQPPIQYLKEYDRALQMLDMEVSDTVTLDQQSFDALVNDDWQWKGSFIGSNSSYSSTAMTSLELLDD